MRIDHIKPLSLLAIFMLSSLFRRWPFESCCLRSTFVIIIEVFRPRFLVPNLLCLPPADLLDLGLRGLTLGSWLVSFASGGTTRIFWDYYPCRHYIDCTSSAPRQCGSYTCKRLPRRTRLDSTSSAPAMPHVISKSLRYFRFVSLR